ncbi:L-ascorbate oxidase [Rhodovulum sp. BSW8]|uniref:multicopper oxidase family protein n=1 Tax=Rhodovulum sp. BSW8 TaxID=2259645 RepID=UPI000DE43085|nr:multicopper oxidase domain-containing protein [Rhodovulum sp. BSW8]RBO53790.1 L-ascorbate oxidase [Rhodovulum sp. BSW8]
MSGDRFIVSRLPTATLLAAFACSLWAGPGRAQDIAEPPPRAAMLRPEAEGAGARAALESAAPSDAGDRCAGADVCYDLALRYVDGRLRNPAFAETDPRGHDSVRLRAYAGLVLDETGAPVAQRNAYVAPVVEIAPGDTFRLTFENALPRPQDMELPGEDANGNPLRCTGAPEDHNEPSCANFNLTNMHTHGLWVSPQGNSDNVLLTVNPGIRFTYEYNIPNDHPAGTFWYHAHRHGSTAPQVSSGMAGILLIRGDRQPRLGATGWAAPGDLDVILPRPEGLAGAYDGTAGVRFPERTFLFQQIAYACRWTRAEVDALAAGGTPAADLPAVGAIKADADGWFCDEGDVGMVEPGPGNAFDQVGFGSWPRSGRHTAINGEIQKQQQGAVAGRVERWRLIHGGVRETIGLEIRKVEGGTAEDLRARLAEGTGGKSRDAMAGTVAQVCSGAPLDLVRVATDGLTRPDIRTGPELLLQPAYREDVLVSFPSAGTYCIVDAATAPGSDINLNDNGTALLGFLDVAPADAPLAGDGGVDQVMAMLQRSVEARIEDPAAREAILAELAEGRLDAFVKHRDIADQEVSGQQTVGFTIQGPPFAFMIGRIAPTHVDNGAPFALVGAASYEATRFDRILPLGGVEEWTLTSFGGGGHPFHIHVNPFQIAEVLKYQPDAGCATGAAGARHCEIDPNDPATYVDVSGPDSDEPQYAGLKGAWKDTLFILPGHLVKLRTRYERYIGDFVLHCHILDHEDEGMMQNVRIAIPDGRGGFDRPMTEHAMH